MGIRHAAAVAAIAALGAATAHAAVIERTFDFTATGFQRVFANGTPPIDTISGSFSLRFDNAASVQDATDGLTVNSFSFTPFSPLAFNYDAIDDTLAIGALEGTVEGINLDSHDFYFSIADVSSTPVYTFLGYSASTGFFGTSAISAAVPDAATWAMMVGGFGMVGGALRRRRAAGLSAA